MAKRKINQKDIEKYELLYGFFTSIYREIKEFSRKKPDGILNDLKVKILNKRLTEIKELLIEEPTVEYLEELDTELLPSYSDTVIILSQYAEAMKRFKTKYKNMFPAIII